MSSSIWDTPDLQVGGEFVRFDKVGDKVSGTVSVVRPHRFDDGTVAPQILLVTDDGEEKTVTCGAIRLKIAMAEQRPEAGDHVSIELVSEEKRSGGKTLRHWKVDVTRKGATPAPVAAPAPSGRQGFSDDPAPVAAPAAAPAAASPEALAAALSNLTPEQKQALGL